MSQPPTDLAGRHESNPRPSRDCVSSIAAVVIAIVGAVSLLAGVTAAAGGTIALPSGPAGSQPGLAPVGSSSQPTQSRRSASWTTAPSMPESLGEVACGVIDDKLYLVGEGSNHTLAWDFSTQSWTNALAPRPFAGHHHAAEVVGNTLYLIGGLGGGSEGKVQAYDPASDSWSLRARLPWAGGAVSTCAIGGRIYAAGGIVGSTTVDFCATYDPSANAWRRRASMPFQQGRNHAAGGTDGARFYVFGGRGIGSGEGNWVANGFDTTQVYDPATNLWESSADPGSTLAPLPQARGGMGKAVFLGGELYVIGGETIDGGGGATSQGVYARVDVYDPTTNAWRAEAPMSTARHGIFPVRYQGRIHVPGGGVAAGHSSSSVFEVFTRL